jgi:arabinofuranosyltransferase
LPLTARSFPPSAPAPYSPRRIIEAFLIAAFTYVFLANAWLGDDAYITFRVIWNLLHGYGAVFNPPERVQAYTHPLWMLVLAGAHAVTREFFFTALVVSYGFSLAAVVAIARAAEGIAGRLAVFVWLISSKAFIDYTSSGLENPLGYFLLALFYVPFCRVSDEPLSDRTLRRFGLLAGLAFVNRIDSAILYALPLMWLGIRSLRRPDERILPLCVGFGVPAGVWLAFATLYYGFPLPNTYYAKVATGIPAALLQEQGFAYVLNSFAHDPITLATIGIAGALAFRSTTAVRMAVASALLYVAFTISVGGDFMSGRFFATPFVIAMIAIVGELRGWDYHPALAGVLLIYNLLMPIVPVKTTASYDAAWPWRSQNGIKDERGHYHRITNVFFYSPFRTLPDHTWMREGLSFSQSPDKVTVQGSIGFYGLQAGPAKHLVDRNALSDPLLARLPVSWQLYFEFYAGHYFRDLPEGYLESIANGDNRIADPQIHAYYDRLLDVTRGPLWRGSRLASIWYLNVGEGRRFARRYESRRPIDLSIRAANERFATDVGERDPAGGTLRTAGRAGYLQFGPGIPMKPGKYRARWIGTAAAASGAVGFVDVWGDGRQIARRDVTAADAQPDQRSLAEITFTLEEPVRSLDYRFWVHANQSAVLERVELATSR